jgi:coenzyme F420 hydrogenase subunit beta
MDDLQLTASGSAERLTQTVIDGGFCIGCGVCATAAPDAFRMAMDGVGRWQAEPLPAGGIANDISVTSICPFGEGSPSEDELAGTFLETNRLRYDTAMGYFAALWAGHAPDEYRDVSSSGGLATWFACRLLDMGEVDAVAHVLPTSADGEPLFAYGISRTSDEVRAGGKSHYQSVEMSKVLMQMRETPGRFLVIGVPCFIEALRNLTRFDEAARSSVAYSAAIFCGHMKSSGYGELLGWQMGVPPADLKAISFREKLMDRPADQYGTKVTDKDGRTTTAPVRQLPAADWGLGFFKFKACDYCDDISGETADISFGDVWLPEYTADPRGTSFVIVRRPELARLFTASAESGELSLEPLTRDQGLRSQDANFRQRREGLAYRIDKARKQGTWVPPKRVVAMSRHLTRAERRRFDIRAELSAESHAAFRSAKEAGDLAVFDQRLAPLVETYRRLTSRRLVNAAFRRLRRSATQRRRQRGFLAVPPR